MTTLEDRKIDVLAVGPHPDDVEIGCGGTLAACVASGKKVGIAILTRGERGTRGTLAQRQAEAREAARRLGAAELEFLDCGDGALRVGEEEEDQVIELLRSWRPEVVLGPPAKDRHPDHERGHTLLRQSCFYAGLRKRGNGEPHRPAAVFSYMLHHVFDPSFVVDVTASWPQKMAALDAYESQLYRPQQEADDRAEPETKVSSREFRLALEGRARHYGQMIGAEFGEPFESRTPLAVDDVWSLRPGGHR